MNEHRDEPRVDEYMGHLVDLPPCEEKVSWKTKLVGAVICFGVLAMAAAGYLALMELWEFMHNAWIASIQVMTPP